MEYQERKRFSLKKKERAFGHGGQITKLDIPKKLRKKQHKYWVKQFLTIRSQYAYYSVLFVCLLILIQ